MCLSGTPLGVVKMKSATCHRTTGASAGHIDANFEAVQRRATKLIPGFKDPATRNDFVNDIVNDGKHFHRRRWYSTIATISSKLDTLTFDQRLERFSLRSGYLRSFI